MTTMETPNTEMDHLPDEPAFSQGNTQTRPIALMWGPA